MATGRSEDWDPHRARNRVGENRNANLLLSFGYLALPSDPSRVQTGTPVPSSPRLPGLQLRGGTADPRWIISCSALRLLVQAEAPEIGGLETRNRGRRRFLLTLCAYLVYALPARRFGAGRERRRGTIGWIGHAISV